MPMGSMDDTSNTPVTVNGLSGTTTKTSTLGNTTVAGYTINIPPAPSYTNPILNFINTVKFVPFSSGSNENAFFLTGSGVSLTLQESKDLTNISGLLSLASTNNSYTSNSIYPPIQLTDTLLKTALTEINVQTNSPIRYLVASDFVTNNPSTGTMMVINSPKKGQVDFLNFTANASLKGDFLDLSGFNGVALVSGPINVGNITNNTEVIDAGNGAILNTSDNGASIIIAQGGSTINGGSGLDKVILPQTTSTGAHISIVSGNTSNIQNLKIRIDMPGQAQTELNGVERIQFSDKTLALDVGPDSLIAKTYSLYTVFGKGRTPDPDGMGYWIREIDANPTPQGLSNIAHSILYSQEFTNKYGSFESNSSLTYTNILFENFLGRSATFGELLYYSDLIASKRYTPEMLLQYFAFSPEVMSIIGSSLKEGLLYTPYHP